MSCTDKYKPAVSKLVLLLVAGGIWVCIGSAMLYLAISWLLDVSIKGRIVFALLGVALALLFNRFAFRKIVDKNIQRILPVSEKRCVFSFMPWKSYLIIPVMITIGVVLRHSAVPKPYLAVVYSCIGLALVLSGFRYLRVLFVEARKESLSPNSAR